MRQSALIVSSCPQFIWRVYGFSKFFRQGAVSSWKAVAEKGKEVQELKASMSCESDSSLARKAKSGSVWEKSAALSILKERGYTVEDIKKM